MLTCAHTHFDARALLFDGASLSLLCFLFVGAVVKTEAGAEPEVTVKEEEKEEKKEKEDKKEKDVVKKEEKDREREKEKEREKERPTRGGGSSSSSVLKEEKEKPGSSSQPEESVGERLAMVGGSKRKEMEQLKIVRAELK